MRQRAAQLLALVPKSILLIKAALQKQPRAALAVAGLVLLVVLVWILGPGAAWVLESIDGVTGLVGKDRAEALDAIRGRALTVTTGLAALVAVYYTARNAETTRRTYEVGQRQLALSEEGHLTDRYTRAIEQLGSSELAVRLGGIYALERIARDSARDHPTVMEVLTAFIRDPPPLATPTRAPVAGGRPGVEQAAHLRGRPRLRADVQAALTVIGRRTVENDAQGRRIDLAEADLAGADLAGARLHGADLAQANLADADLKKADLSGANLWRADLTRADLTGANAATAIFEGAKVTDLTLAGANLLDARFDGVDVL
ncbi:pentapeptide repeat-containing protein [Planotetraspora kaengkrachanensis]|uniref:pentapeptide repeat-containing protein n=1 Tax=Planotetraspora kaengkrachanensis TaxID=575193 RepID=UPI001EF247CF|nr:pentapeptide repeat-containing protein [Planotetraspora kaengkrachanensis]